MKNRVIIILIIATTGNLAAQIDSSKTADIDSLYVRTLRTQLGMILSSGYKYFEINERTERIKNVVNVDRFKFLTREQLVNQSIEQKTPIAVYFINYKIVSPDTVDINIGDATLTAKKSIHFNHGLKTRKVNYAVSCGGTDGYVPTERYAFNHTTMTWDKIEFVKPKRYRDTLIKDKMN